MQTEQRKQKRNNRPLPTHNQRRRQSNCLGLRVEVLNPGRDPIWWMGSTASLKSQFNLASVSSFDVKAYTMHDLLDWDFHVLALPEPEAVRLCRDLLVYYADRAALGIRGEVIMNFCGALHANYLPNPYHNFYHALNVVQVLCLLLALPDVGARFSPTDYFVLSVAALGHDLGHPGFNNLFMQRNQTSVEGLCFTVQ
ncbi:3'5'cyclic nucleotide phosphodiesterase, related [Eimeria maxima]|uniref:3'5'cyclic nucleotide phosphodiesterase, related n=1 Tax=Eimeria maxima TaxID=5804 RepID=U6LZF4_EIMMA|nr:3'5'cyclic nucleotide phosphodiesterase, related [Eimeria maxima]CDJ56238.1 3'5'cyclic nucleotide phosphodiesterase, related [Eimeria maxima]